jgi:hypothetical protein
MSLWGDVNFHQNRDNMNLVVQSCHATGIGDYYTLKYCQSSTLIIVDGRLTQVGTIGLHGHEYIKLKTKR